MSFRDTLKKLGITEDESQTTEKPKVEPTPKADAKVAQSSPQPQASVGSRTPAIPAGTETGPGADEQTASILDVSAIERRIEEGIRGLSGFGPVDQFLKIVEGMKKSVPDVGQRFRAAAEMTHITSEQLTIALQSVQSVLDQHTAEFEGEFVKNGRGTIDAIAHDAELLADQITIKSNELNALSEKRAGLIAQTIQQTSELEKAQADFKSTISTVRSRYEDLAGQFELHLKEQK
jgi:hypothetical protein